MVIKFILEDLTELVLDSEDQVVVEYKSMSYRGKLTTEVWKAKEVPEGMIIVTFQIIDWKLVRNTVKVIRVIDGYADI